MSRLITAENDQPDMPTPAEQYLAWRIAELLNSLYPGHLWGVHVKKTMATIRNMALSGSHGYQLHLEKMRTEDEFKSRITRAGGEILERFNLSRGQARRDELLNLKRDFAKRPVFDGSK